MTGYSYWMMVKIPLDDVSLQFNILFFPQESHAVQSVFYGDFKGLSSTKWDLWVATPWWLWLVLKTAGLGGAAVQVWPVQQILQAWNLSNLSSHRWKIFSDFPGAAAPMHP